MNTQLISQVAQTIRAMSASERAALFREFLEDEELREDLADILFLDNPPDQDEDPMSLREFEKELSAEGRL